MIQKKIKKTKKLRIRMITFSVTSLSAWHSKEKNLKKMYFGYYCFLFLLQLCFACVSFFFVLEPVAVFPFFFVDCCLLWFFFCVVDDFVVAAFRCDAGVGESTFRRTDKLLLVLSFFGEASVFSSSSTSSGFF